MANGIAQLAVGLALVGAIGGSPSMIPVHRTNPDVAFLERVASAVEQVQPIGPQMRGPLSELASRHRGRLADAQLELRRQEALERITAAMQPAEPAGPARSGGRRGK